MRLATRWALARAYTAAFKRAMLASLVSTAACIAAMLASRLPQIGLGVGEVAARLNHLRLVNCRGQLRQHLVSVNSAIEVGKDVLDCARN